MEIILQNKKIFVFASKFREIRKSEKLYKQRILLTKMRQKLNFSMSICVLKTFERQFSKKQLPEIQKFKERAPIVTSPSSVKNNAFIKEH